MKLFNILVTAIILLLIGAISITIFSGKRDSHDYIQFPDDLIPGSKFPEGATCEYPPASFEMLCVRGEWYISYDYSHGRVMSIATFLEFKKITIGDVIDAWGIPKSIQASIYDVEISWGDKYVTTGGKNFSPTSIIKLTGWSSYDNKYNKPWSGFTVR